MKPPLPSEISAFEPPSIHPSGQLGIKIPKVREHGG